MAVVQHAQRRVVTEDDRSPVIVERDSPASAVASVIYLIGGTISAILAIRFLFVLLGANAGNTFVNFIYDISRPFVAPFFGMFNYTPQFGIARFEYETLIAIVVYGLVTMLLVRALTIGRRTDVV